MTRRGALLAAAIWLGPSLVFMGLATIIYGHFRIDSAPRLEHDQRAQLMLCLRAGLRGEALPTSPGLARKTTPIVVRVYYQGNVRARYQSRADSLAQACKQIAEEMAIDTRITALRAGSIDRTRLRVDRVVGRGPLLLRPSLLAAMSVHPGLDGLGAAIGAQEVYLLPSELVDGGLLVRNRPLSYVPDLVFGFDQKKAEPTLRALAGLDAEAWAAASKSYFRLRVESFVETGDGSVAPLERDLLPAPNLTAESLRQGAIDGGRYLVAHMGPNGRYIYKANLSSGRQSSLMDRSYSLPRHAGTTYYLAELYRHTGEAFLLEPIERAIGHLSELVQAADCQGTSDTGQAFVCVSDRGQPTSDLGSTALAVVALAEYQRATGSVRYQPLMLQMAEFLLYMQRKDGSFAHRYNWRTQTIDDELQLLYYSGEAALALARVHKLSGQERHLQAVERALDWLVGWYEFFLGGFFFGEEHWTCIAAEAAYPDLDDPRYLQFCEDYGRFLRRNQPDPGTFQDQEGWSGAYYFTPFLAPQNTPAGSRSESMISTYMLGRHHGRELPAVKRQVLHAMRYALAQQVRAGDLFRVPHAVSGLGAVPGGPIDRDVRIDYVQHVCSAMLRAIPLLQPESLSGSPDGVLGSPE